MANTEEKSHYLVPERVCKRIWWEEVNVNLSKTELTKCTRYGMRCNIIVESNVKC